MMLVPGVLVLLMLVVRDADQPGILVWMVLSGMFMNLTMVPVMSGVWKAGALEAQVSNFTLFLSQI